MEMRMWLFWVVVVACSGVVAGHSSVFEAGSGDAKTACPICNMKTMDFGYKDKWYVTFNHGQILYTCGMTNVEFSHPVEFAATMDQYVVKCDDAKHIWSNNNKAVNDPISGANVTIFTDRKTTVCFKRGQMLFFASETNQKLFLSKIKTQQNYAVADVICDEKTCTDKGKYTTSSVTKKPVDSTKKPDQQTNISGAPLGGDESFCTGGSVMFNGFMTTMDKTCVKLFFQPWVLNTKVKYAFGVIGVFLFAMSNELIIMFRRRLKQHILLFLRKSNSSHKNVLRLALKFVLGLFYAIQMTVAYLLMLVVMTYDSILFIALVLGFGAGFFFLKDFPIDDNNQKNEKVLSQATSQPIEFTSWSAEEKEKAIIFRVPGMKCMKNCGSTVQAALLNLAAVSKVCIDMSEKHCFISVSSSDLTGENQIINELANTIEDIGFEVEKLSMEVSNQIKDKYIAASMI